MNILGLSCFYHDSAAALVSDGEIIAVAQEECFTRKKHDFNFPINAINFCLSEGNMGIFTNTKKWWLAPIIIILLLLGLLIFFTQGSTVAPFIYTLF